jgi:hypothetical protein
MDSRYQNNDEAPKKARRALDNSFLDRAAIVPALLDNGILPIDI